LLYDEFILHGCETWSLKLWKEYKLRAFENRALRRIHGPKRDEGAGICRKLHNVELHNSYSSLYIISMMKLRIMRWVVNVVRGEKKIFWQKGMKPRDHFGNRAVDWKRM
jgi:hypothetical protein